MVCDVAMIIVSQKEAAYFNRIKPQKKAKFANKKFKIAAHLQKFITRNSTTFPFRERLFIKKQLFSSLFFFLTGTIEQK